MTSRLRHFIRGIGTILSLHPPSQPMTASDLRRRAQAQLDDMHRRVRQIQPKR